MRWISEYKSHPYLRQLLLRETQWPSFQAGLSFQLQLLRLSGGLENRDQI